MYISRYYKRPGVITFVAHLRTFIIESTDEYSETLT